MNQSILLNFLVCSKYFRLIFDKKRFAIKGAASNFVGISVSNFLFKYYLSKLWYLSKACISVFPKERFSKNTEFEFAFPKERFSKTTGF